MSKSLIIYFSRADENYAVGYITKGNTQIVAEYVQELTGADMFKVEPAVPYARDYNTCIREAKQRIGNAPIKEKLTDISAYETVFIMSPIYWGTYAPEVETALEGLVLGHIVLDLLHLLVVRILDRAEPTVVLLRVGTLERLEPLGIGVAIEVVACAILYIWLVITAARLTIVVVMTRCDGCADGDEHQSHNQFLE